MARTEYVKYLVMVPNYWGIGDTVDDAVEELIGAGGYIAGGYTIYEFPERTIFQSVHPVYGEITFSDADKTAKPASPREFPVPARLAIETRRKAIRLALVNDDMDEDNREILKEEFENLGYDLTVIEEVLAEKEVQID